MPRLPRPVLSGLLGLLLATAPGAASGQWLDDPLLGRFGVRIGSLPSVVNWNERFGPEGTVPLGEDLTSPALGTALLPHLAPLEEALGGGTGSLRLGRIRAVRSTTVVTVPISLELGLTSFLTVGATVPFIRRRIESDLAFSGEGATVGFNPALEDPGGVEAFLEGLGMAVDSVSVRVAELCAAAPGGEDCLRGEEGIRRGDELRAQLDLLYRGPLMPLDDSPAGLELRGRLAELAEVYGTLGVALDPTAPLSAAPLDREGLDLLLSAPALGVGLEGLTTVQRPWEIGDAEFHASVGLVDRVATDTAGAFRSRLQVVAGAMLRIPTGTAPVDSSPLDPGTGGGTRDVTGSITADLARPRWGLRGAVRMTLRGESEEIRRLAPPEVLLAGIALRAPVTRDAGNVMEAEVAPRVALAPNFGIGGSWRMLRRGEDRFRAAGSPAGVDGDPFPPTPPDASVLAAGSGGTVHWAGIMATYSTANLAREGAYGGRPFDILVRLERAVASSGGIRAPRDTRLKAGLRLYIGPT